MHEDSGDKQPVLHEAWPKGWGRDEQSSDYQSQRQFTDGYPGSGRQFSKDAGGCAKQRLLSQGRILRLGDTDQISFRADSGKSGGRSVKPERWDGAYCTY